MTRSSAFQASGKISSETPIYAPLSGTVVQRKVGPGQYVSYTSTGAVDPVFTIGNLSTVWLVAYVRESEAPKVRVGQQLDFTVLAYPKTTFKANIDHVAASLDPNMRRLMVRATIDNSKRPVQAGDVHVGHHLHRRGRQLARRAARCGHLRGRQRAGLDRAQRQDHRVAADQDRHHAAAG